MRRCRPINRRSFMGRVVGGAIVAGGPLAALSGPALAHPERGIVDTDVVDTFLGNSPNDGDSGAMSDPPHRGRGGAEARRMWVVDADIGATADPRGYGRGPVREPDTGEDEPRVEGTRGFSLNRPHSSEKQEARRSARTAAPRSGPTERFVPCPGDPRCPPSPRRE